MLLKNGSWWTHDGILLCSDDAQHFYVQMIFGDNIGVSVFGIGCSFKVEDDEIFFRNSQFPI